MTKNIFNAYVQMQLEKFPKQLEWKTGLITLWKRVFDLRKRHLKSRRRLENLLLVNWKILIADTLQHETS